MNWIQTRHRLPQEGRDHKVLICKPHFEKEYEHVNFCDYHIAYIYNNNWILGTGYSPEYSFDEYCYWTPLTQPEIKK